MPLPVDIIKAKFPDLNDVQMEFAIACFNLGQSSIADILQEQNLKKEEKIKAKKQAFADMLRPFLGQYDKDTLNEFYRYWTEANKSMTKLKWELEPTFEVSLRLARWVNNQRVNKPEAPKDRYK